MPFLLPRSSSAPAHQKATNASLAVKTVASTEPEIATVTSSNPSPIRLPIRHRKKSSTPSISKSSISPPTPSSSQPLTLSTTWQPLDSTEPAFERPRPSPVPPSPSMATQQSPSIPVRPTSYTAMRRSPSPPTRSNQLRIPPSPGVTQPVQASRSQSLPSDTERRTTVALIMVKETAASIEGSRQDGEQTSPTSAGQRPSTSIVRQSIFQPRKAEEGPKTMTAWERIGERRAREMGRVL